MSTISAKVRATIEQELLLIPGWCTVEKGIRMAELTWGAELCVELGVFGGRSTIAMALSLCDQGRGRVDAIDPYEPFAALEGTNSPANDEWWSQLDYSAIAKEAQLAFGRLGVHSRAHLIRLHSRDVAPFYADASIDVLHQDSNHSEEISCEEITLWAPKMRRDGYWILDDADWETTKKAQSMLVELGFAELENHGTWKVYRNQPVDRKKAP